ncbi:hypothetical protein F442_19961 [Phytophthora nicotianae P10297]|uniref:Uncharacterized protein n=1 Tax=Phytophthora nicotianae P10297 TaxID=1317064 RepID=W2YAB9_PHYNI|nr:hypothetical protein F442_19961 [Phytophthora nicotianae P10297]
MDQFLVRGETAANYQHERWSARPLVEERSALQALTATKFLNASAIVVKIGLKFVVLVVKIARCKSNVYEANA